MKQRKKKGKGKTTQMRSVLEQTHRFLKGMSLRTALEYNGIEETFRLVHAQDVHKEQVSPFSVSTRSKCHVFLRRVYTKNILNAKEPLVISFPLFFSHAGFRTKSKGRKMRDGTTTITKRGVPGEKDVFSSRFRALWK